MRISIQSKSLSRYLSKASVLSFFLVVVERFPSPLPPLPLRLPPLFLPDGLLRKSKPLSGSTWVPEDPSSPRASLPYADARRSRSRYHRPREYKPAFLHSQSFCFLEKVRSPKTPHFRFSYAIPPARLPPDTAVPDQSGILPNISTVILSISISPIGYTSGNTEKFNP